MKIGRSVLFLGRMSKPSCVKNSTLNRPSSDTPKKNGNVTIRKG